MNKKYIKTRIHFWLDMAEANELENLKAFIKENANDDRVPDLCTVLGIIVALKNQAKDLIEKL